MSNATVLAHNSNINEVPATEENIFSDVCLNRWTSFVEFRKLCPQSFIVENWVIVVELLPNTESMVICPVLRKYRSKGCQFCAF
ncbi:hypothetical protein [Candidatus Rhodobacter oscarellae]|uniref:hypothetical protein n=1 Tax=Candidatus Rhodobacter oscarellae TaxID=1675527 RepID=UPI000A798ECA|nr:hypothetical protein [Candidatus Rhodobacter lobularis]